jgi:hypothetical protein
LQIKSQLIWNCHAAYDVGERTGWQSEQFNVIILGGDDEHHNLL